MQPRPSFGEFWMNVALRGAERHSECGTVGKRGSTVGIHQPQLKFPFTPSRLGFSQIGQLQQIDSLNARPQPNNSVETKWTKNFLEMPSNFALFDFLENNQIELNRNVPQCSSSSAIQLNRDKQLIFANRIVHAITVNQMPNAPTTNPSNVWMGNWIDRTIDSLRIRQLNGNLIIAIMAKP